MTPHTQRTRRRLGLSALLMLAVLPAATALAQPAQAPGAPPATEPAPLFEQLDTNHDGFVTVEEAKRSAEVTARFKNLDTDRDAKVSLDEFKEGMQEKLTK